MLRDHSETRPEANHANAAVRENPFAAADVQVILRRRGWLAGEISTGQAAWCERAAQLLGRHAKDAMALESWLGLVFHYEAGEIFAGVESHVVLSRYGAREVMRRLAPLVIGGPRVDSNRFKEIVTALKAEMDSRGRELFHPIRLALTGCAGEGELDRVILLIDEAAALPWEVPVKNAAARILEFCAALD